MKLFLSTILLTFGSIQTFALVGEGGIGFCTNLTTIHMDGTESDMNACDTSNKNGLVLLDFMSATCTYCLGSLPETADFAKEMRGQLTIRQIGVDRNTDLLREYWSNNKQYMEFDLALDNKRVMKNKYEVTGVPSYVILDQNKKIIFSHEGTLEKSDLDTIRQLVRQSNP